MILDNLTTSILTPNEIKNGYFLDNPYHNEFLSCGRRHMAEVAIRSGGRITCNSECYYKKIKLNGNKKAITKVAFLFDRY